MNNNIVSRYKVLTWPTVQQYINSFEFKKH